MRITLLSGWYYPDSTGGTEAYVHALARDLLAMGHEVRVAAPAIDDVERESLYDGVSVYRYPISLNPSQAEIQGAAPPAYFQIFESWLSRHAPEIVHMHSFTRGCGAYHLEAAVRHGCRTVITVHTPDVVCSRGTLMRWGTTACDGTYRPTLCAACCLQERGLPRFAALPVAWASRRTSPSSLPNAARTALQYRHLLDARRNAIIESLTRADSVVAVSQWLYDMLVATGVPSDRLTLSRQGLTETVAPIRGSHRASGERLRIGYIGRLNAVKGVDVLIQGFRRLPQTHRTELHIFGSAQDADGKAYELRLRALAGRDHRILFHGELRPSDRQQALGSIDLLAVPSVWFETGPLVVLEAFAAGLPVIGSDLGGIPERVKHGVSGWLVAPGDGRAWAAALDLLYQRWNDGNWDWSLPNVRRSHEVALEMDELYRNLAVPSAIADAALIK